LLQTDFHCLLKVFKGEEPFSGIQADAMRRKGIAENLVARELKSMEFAFRKALCRAAMTTPFGAS
jgi:hypothetical protein